jgi:hypothetical protein
MCIYSKRLQPMLYEVIITSNTWHDKYYICAIERKYIYIPRLIAQLQNENRIKATHAYFVRYQTNNYFKITGFDFWPKVGVGLVRVKFLETRRNL